MELYVNPTTGERLFYPFAPQGTRGLAFSPDGRTLATSTAGKIYLWEVASAQLRGSLSCPAQYLDHLKFSSSNLLAAGGRGVGWLWDWRASPIKPVKPLAAKELDRLWSDLGSASAFVGHRAIVTLSTAPDQAVQLLGQRLRPVEQVTAKGLDRLITELDDKKFAVRKLAMDKLQLLAEVAKPALQHALKGKPPLERRLRLKKLLVQLDGPPHPERLRHLRGVEVLELIGTTQARNVLTKLAQGMAGCVETQDAQAALRRLKDRG